MFIVGNKQLNKGRLKFLKRKLKLLSRQLCTFAVLANFRLN